MSCDNPSYMHTPLISQFEWKQVEKHNTEREAMNVVSEDLLFLSAVYRDQLSNIRRSLFTEELEES